MQWKSGMEKNRNWILIRGLVRGSFHWHKFPEKLAKAFPNDTIHMFDIPGNGRRNTEMSPLSIDEYTDDLRFQARRLDRIHIVTLSLGGMIALDWLSHHPEEVEAAFISNTSLGDTGPFYKRLNYLNYPRIAKSFFGDASIHEKLILDLTSNNLKVHPEVLPEFIALAGRFPVERANFFRQLYAAGRSRFNPNLSRYKNLHFTVSRNDRLVYSENTMNLCKKLGLNPLIHPWAGHDLTLDDPEFMVNHCVDVLSKTQP